MINRAGVFIFILLATVSLHAFSEIDAEDARAEVIKFMRSVGWDKKLAAGVKVSADGAGVIEITDEGVFIVQYMIVGPAVCADAKIDVDSNVKILRSVNKAVVVTHGWLDKSAGDWPYDIAEAITGRVDPNEWVCVFFDWRGGAAVINPVDAAKYARDIAGPRLAGAVKKLGVKFEHIHLIGHSAGSWAVNSAAKILARDLPAAVHITFLDAYVPPKWDEKKLGDIKGNPGSWVEHYYTKDITLKVTQMDLSNAYNVDITAIDPWIKEHEFPYRWYYATIAGQYKHWVGERKEKVVKRFAGVDYGFDRSKEAAAGNWKKSLSLKKGKRPVRFRKI